MRFSSTNVFETPMFQAATQLAPVAPPKVKPKQQGYPGFATGVTPSESALRRTDLALAGTDITSFRTESDSRKLIANFIRSNPDIAAAAGAYLRVGLTQDYRCWARNMDGSLNREATMLALELLRRWDLVPNYVEDGFSQTTSVRSHAESLALDILSSGACCTELVLDKARLPAKLAGVPTVDLKFYQDDKGLRPVQVIAGTEIDLDYPTIIYTSLDQPLKSAYAYSPMESAIQPTLADAQFMNDLRRIMRRALLPRLQAIIDSEKIMTMVPLEIQQDPVALAQWQANAKSQIEDVVNGLSPEDALVTYDIVAFDYVSGGTGDAPDVIKVLQELLNAKQASGTKVMPSVLGHGAGTQNVASSETLLFMKTADGTIRSKLNEHFSKILTLAVRLLGQDVAVYFRYDDIELRPKSELEAFYAMRQARYMELWSVGLLSDDEAAIELTGQVAPAGFTTLSGTMFFQAKAGGTGDNPYSGTGDGSKSGGGALNQAVKSNAPKKAGGKSQ